MTSLGKNDDPANAGGHLATRQNAISILSPISAVRLARLCVYLLVAVTLFVSKTAVAQPPQCDPTKVTGPMRCAKCHENEVRVWQQTPHAKTFEELHRRPEAKAIASKMGLRSVKRGDVCLDCHYTSQHQNGRASIVAGISCESCHGAANDWVTVHNDYGGPTILKNQESAEHKLQRRQDSINLGMRNPSNIYSVARSCFQCHSVPNESLVNVGGHKAGSLDFELVSWSQGINRHNFMRTDNTTNAENSPEKLRVMFVAGLIADLEFSTRATAVATEKSQYGITVAQRAAKVALKLKTIQEQIQDPHLQVVLVSFSQAVLKTNNNEQLNLIADQIQQAGLEFASQTDGAKLAALDAQIPNRSQYK